MVTGRLRTYSDTPCDISTLVDLNDYFTGDGIETTYNLVNKEGYRLGETVQSKDTFWNRFNSTVSVSGNSFTLATPPDIGAVVIAGGAHYIAIRAYDVNVVEGDASPRVKQYPFYIAPESVDDIIQFKFVNNPSLIGIKVEMVDKDNGYGADLSWLEIAPSNPDGSPGTYQAASIPLYIPNIESADLLQSAILSGATSIDVLDGNKFNEGDYLILEPGTVLEEQVHCTAIVGNTLTITPTANAHALNSTVYQWAIKVWLRTNIPLNASGGVPVNLNEISPKLVGSAESRI